MKEQYTTEQKIKYYQDKIKAAALVIQKSDNPFEIMRYVDLCSDAAKRLDALILQAGDEAYG